MAAQIVSRLKMEGNNMAIGERIRFIRNLRGMTQKFLGMQVGFSERTADIRMAQYESGSRTPKADLVEQLADALDVSTEALNVPNIDSYTGLMHTLFALEDLYGFKIDRLDGEICIRINRQNGSTFAKMTGLLEPWEEMAQKYRNGEISREEYDQWRYRYPRSEAAVIPSMVEEVLTRFLEIPATIRFTADMATIS